MSLFPESSIGSRADGRVQRGAACARRQSDGMEAVWHGSAAAVTDAGGAPARPSAASASMAAAVTLSRMTAAATAMRQYSPRISRRYVVEGLAAFNGG